MHVLMCNVTLDALTICIVFHHRRGTADGLLYNLAVSSIAHDLYSAVSCCHPLNNSQHGFRDAFHAARTDTNPWLLCFRIKILYQFLTPWQSLNEYLQFQRYKFHPLLFEGKGTLTFGTALYYCSSVIH